MRSTARSRSGKAPTSSASCVLWSESVTRAALPPWMTWKFVTMWPDSSQMKPVPVPRGTCCTLSENMFRWAASVVMCTTEGEALRNISMLATSSAVSAPRGAAARGVASVRACSGGDARPAASTQARAWARARLRLVMVGEPVFSDEALDRGGRRVLNVRRARAATPGPEPDAGQLTM